MWRRTRWATLLLACSLAACSDSGLMSTTTANTVDTPATAAASTSTSTTTAAISSTTLPPEPHRVFPVQDAAHSSFADEHHDYPAADIFTAHGCGAPLVAPVDGVVLEVNRVDEYKGGTGGPAARGGISLAIRGNDGVRYYMAHFRALEEFLTPGLAITAGTIVGQMGRTGRAGACHLHFALSPICPNPDWWVRRGVIWPQHYLRDWKQGIETSPVAEIQTWSAANPDICSTPATN